MKRLSLFAAAFLLCCRAASATNPTYQNLGNFSGNTTAHVLLTAVANSCSINDLMIAATSYTTIASTFSSVTDPAGNTWSAPVDTTSISGLAISTSSSIVTVNLTASGNFSFTYAGDTAAATALVCVHNYGGQASPLDKHNINTNGSGTSAGTISTGTLTQAKESIIGFLTTTPSSGTVTCNGSYVRTTTVSATPSISICDQYVTSNSSVSFAPSWVNSRSYITMLQTYLGPLPGGKGPGLLGGGL